jgi:hypothetical protein
MAINADKIGYSGLQSVEATTDSLPISISNDSDPFNSTDLKWITVEVPGYGNVTVREDMVVKDGDDIRIVANKDADKVGLITPLVEKLPAVEYVKVDTPYGPIEVTTDTYKLLGKEKVVANHVAFMEQLIELDKNRLFNSNNVSSNTTYEQTIAQDTPLVAQRLDRTFHMEAAFFYRRDSGYQPNSSQCPL